MLELEVVIEEGLDESTNRFVALKSFTIQLEHSLVSLSKWESKWEKPFLKDTAELSDEMFLDYIRCMLLDPQDEKTLKYLSQANIVEINEYINSKQSAAWLADKAQGSRSKTGKVITSDLIYYWMVALTIPFDAETWHLNRLIMLIRITELENQPKKKMSRSQSMASHRSLLAQRRAQYGTNG